VRERRLLVWLYIHYRVWKKNNNTLKIGNKVLCEWGVDPATKVRALRDFEQAGLITVQWRGNKSPLVTLRSDLSMLSIRPMANQS
jgi:hypothetical protein